MLEVPHSCPVCGQGWESSVWAAIRDSSTPWANLFECLIFSEENAQHPQSLDLPCGNMNCNTGHRPECFPDPEPLRYENSGRKSLCAKRHVCPAQALYLRFLTVNSWP